MAETGQTKAPAITGVEIWVCAHATEDEVKVERAVLNMIPEAVGRPISKVQRLSGHHNDPILLMRMRINKRKAAGEMFRNIVRSLSPLDRQRLFDEAEDRVDEAGNLYLRLDKQDAYRGRAMLCEADPIRMKFRFRVPHGADPASTVRAYIAEVERGTGL